jgi:iron complex transport system ATP-binding protein
VIEADGVSVSLGGSDILDDVSLAAERGDFVGLVGPNGAGKTTLLRVASGVLDPDAGRVLTDGEDIHDLSSRAASRSIAVVPQDTAVSFAFDVESVVAMGRHPYRNRFRGVDSEGGDHVASAMDRVDVSRFADRSIDAVSSGERQRVLLARALAQDTPCLLLDEPTASLDVTRAVETLSLVRDLTDEGKTAVAAIHDLNLAARFCDRIVVIAEGETLARGDPESVLDGETLTEAFDGETTVRTDPVTGTPSVTAFPNGVGEDENRS